MIQYLNASDVRLSACYCGRRLWGSMGAGCLFTNERSPKWHHGDHPNGQEITLIRGRNWMRADWESPRS